MLVEIWYAALNADGTVAQFEMEEVDDEGPNVPFLEGAFTYVQLAGRPSPGPQPTPSSVLRLVDGAPVWAEQASIGALRAAKNREINAWRAKANFASFPFQGKDIACDTLSRSDIDAVANHIGLFGAFPPSFPMAWKAIDNTFIPLPDIDAFKAMYASMTAQGTINFDHSQALKEQLGKATTAGEIEAIVWKTPTSA